MALRPGLPEVTGPDRPALTPHPPRLTRLLAQGPSLGSLWPGRPLRPLPGQGTHSGAEANLRSQGASRAVWSLPKAGLPLGAVPSIMMPAQLGTHNFISLLCTAGGPCYPRRPSKTSGDTHLGSPQGRADCKGSESPLGSAVFELYIVASCQARGCGLQKPVWPLGLLQGHWAFVARGLREAGCIYATAPRG